MKNLENKNGKKKLLQGARDIMVTIVENWHGHPSSNIGRSYLNFTFGKGKNPIILPPSMGK